MVDIGYDLGRDLEDNFYYISYLNPIQISLIIYPIEKVIIKI